MISIILIGRRKCVRAMRSRPTARAAFTLEPTPPPVRIRSSVCRSGWLGEGNRHLFAPSTLAVPRPDRLIVARHRPWGVNTLTRGCERTWGPIMAKLIFGAVIALLAVATSLPAAADDLLRLAIGQRGLWDSSIAELGQAAGIFRRSGLELQVVYTSGGGETQQAVISGSVDIGVAAGTLGVLGAYAKGAPVRIIAGEAPG